VTRLLSLAVLLIAAAGAFVWLQAEKPAPYARMIYPLRYEQIVRAHARNYDLDPALLAAVIYQESRFRPDARSPSGAIGLMQLLPDTAKGIAVRTGGAQFRVQDLYDPEINVRYGSWYLRHLLRKYGEVEKALAAYHGGQANVDRGIQYAETPESVARVLELREVYELAYGDDFRGGSVAPPE